MMRQPIFRSLLAAAVVSTGCSGDGAVAGSDLPTDQHALPNPAQPFANGQQPHPNAQQSNGNQQSPVANSSLTVGGTCRSFCAAQNPRCSGFCGDICDAVDAIGGECAPELLDVLRCASALSVICEDNGRIDLQQCNSEAAALGACFDEFGID